jgi:dipeptidyl aminopeptidase/acylaminoacyl peptidase
LLTGVDMAVARGVVDPQRIGLTGLSDGATTVRFALINKPIFAAAAISSCCIDPVNVMTLAGTDFADNYQKMGAPPLTRPDKAYWQAASLTLNAARLDRPLLMQLADDEMLLALESYSALRDYGQPVEMDIFPGEHHIKWQPAHRAAIYARNLEWFAYWLQNSRNPDPAKAAQYARWDAMRAKLTAGPFDAHLAP